MDFTVLLFFKLLFSVNIVNIIVAQEDPGDLLVVTSAGLVRGFASTDGNYSTFAGVRYAQVNASNPFGSALPAPIYEGEFEAYDEQVACPQMGLYNPLETLDCLRLNIYAPNRNNSENPLPVMVWIHGGAFEIGYAGQHSPRHLMRHDIILVTINYRLGPYGFMCLDTAEVPGNAGLKDQVLALRWIKQNIAAFGGDPFRITLAGQSAGSASVNHHMYAPQERLFHRAIMQSSTAQILMIPSNELLAINMAVRLGFNAPDTESAIQFLANSPPGQVTSAASQLNINFQPCIESIVSADSFIPTNPLLATFSRETNNMPVMIGVTSMELLGYGLVYRFYTSFRNAVETLFDVEGEELERLTDIVQHFYAGDERNSSVSGLVIDQLDTDLVQNFPMEREVTKMLQQGVGPVYNYVFEYVSENDWGDRENMRASHSAELKYLFSYNNLNGSFNAEEQEISDRICTMWGNFVRGGNPNQESSALLPWPAVSADTRPYMTIGLEARVGNRFEHANVAFWDLFYKAYGDRERLRVLQLRSSSSCNFATSATLHVLIAGVLMRFVFAF